MPTTNNSQEHEELEQWIRDLGEEINKQESAPGIINPQRYREMRFVYMTAKQLLYGSGLKITSEVGKVYKSVGSITVEGKDIRCSDTIRFARAAEFSDQTEIYPLASGGVRIEFTFHGIMNLLKGAD